METYGKIITKDTTREILIIVKQNNKITYGYEVINDEIKDAVGLTEIDLQKKLPEGFDKEILGLDIKLLFKILKQELIDSRNKK